MTETPPEFDVVVNDEEQYSIWSAGQPLPDGWRRTGYRGGREQCLTHIDQIWTDIRPLSVRRRIERERAEREAVRGDA